MVSRKDIAKEADVSVSVVSRALNNSGYVDAEKKKRIVEVAERLGYRPNPVAMSLARQKTGQIMFYCREIENAFSIELYEGMIKAAEKQNYVVVMQGKLDFESIKGMMIDGIILPSEFITEVYLKDVGQRYYLPVVTAGFGCSLAFSRSVPVIIADLYKGGEIVVEYLRDRGHRKIAMIMPHDIESLASRTQAWHEYMSGEIGEGYQKYYIPITTKGLKDDLRAERFSEEETNLAVPESYFHKGVLAADIFLERRLDVTAAICFNDEMSLGFCKRMKERGYVIPKDVSLISFDGVYHRRYAETPVTTLDMNPKLMGYKCVEVLLDMINGNKFKYVTNIPLKILEGESVKNLNRNR